MARKEWTEVRNGEMFRIMAETTPNGLKFFERSIWEVRWFPMSQTDTLIKMATKDDSGEQNIKSPAAA